ncbi:hypothetical protein FA13DRAFT_71521 [Coprinellus micaceus]|uniref:Uncharacterized protein n=1 Tax=Coprinellus micaceus TaxID=71717 RepID=A0A4Y7TJM1_COPMI|nr:hypothetical protein FA13DRAFT_71521 [Coprinellus micaceus]
MPGKAPHDLEKWYFANESKHKLNEAWQDRLNATKAALASAVVIPSPPPMGSLTPRLDIRMPVYPTHFAPYPASASQPQSRPDYPMAIPFKPQATPTGGGANAAGATPSSTSANATPGQGSPISAFHSPYSAHPLLNAPAYGYSYASPIPFAAMYPHYPPASAVQLPSHPGTPNAGIAQPQPVNGTASGGNPATGPAAPTNPPAAEEAPLGENRQSRLRHKVMRLVM